MVSFGIMTVFILVLAYFFTYSQGMRREFKQVKPANKTRLSKNKKLTEFSDRYVYTTAIYLSNKVS